VGGEGGGGSIFWKTPDTALYSTYVSTLWGRGTYIVCNLYVNMPIFFIPIRKTTQLSGIKRFKPRM
jgi:hypothetical protein